MVGESGRKIPILPIFCQFLRIFSLQMPKQEIIFIQLWRMRTLPNVMENAGEQKSTMRHKLSLGLVTLVVADYDEAIKFYTQKLNFTLIEDTKLSATKRWVVVAPDPLKGSSILLAKAANEKQSTAIGNQTGGRVAFFLYTDNFEAAYKHLLEQQVEIVRPPSTEPYGTVLVFADLYGNQWDLIKKSIVQ